ncbi:S-adenosyl-L-methionine-dependent methyltransferase [Sordaria brevicollis]|uniref:S-adenosyl-L-methionine-dependent methyltransferase n=1 Tax=Sordaria brevicollis TaxID=83679 RepID=A0AAE0PEJ8_SORBR|nr:S-adenosyl-L-methionine-dependent methyltransferase [Sordaria brevicollis]
MSRREDTGPEPIQELDESSGWWYLRNGGAWRFQHTAIGSLPNGHDTGSAIKSLRAVHQITSQYLSNKKDVQADQRNASPDADQDREAFSILTEVKQLLASSGLQDGAVTPPESVTSQPGTPPSNKKRNISPLTLQPSAVPSSPCRPVDKPSNGSGARTPQEVIMGLFAQMSATSAINLFKHWGVFDAIPVPQEVSGAGTVGISFADLARKVDVDEALLIRISKMLTSTSILDRTQNGLHHTPTSLCLMSSHPMSAMFSLLHTNIVSTSTSLPAYFDTYGRREPVGVDHVPITYHEGKPELKYFDLVNQNPKRMEQFMKAMSITHSSRVPTTGMYDMNSVLSAAKTGRYETVWVDIGGGSGHSVKLFLEEYGGPNGLKASRCVVHELEDVMKGAKKAAEEDELLKDVRFLPLDFHDESPVEGALVYYLRHIMRDFSDPVCVNILRNVARSLISDEARILISEQITPDGPPPSGASQPSLSHQMYAAFKDFSMLPLGGKERSLSQWRSVAAAAGLEIVRVHMDPKGTPHGVVELKLASSRE